MPKILGWLRSKAGIRFGIGLVLSVVFVVGSAPMVGDLGAALATLATANYGYLVPAMVLYFVGVGVRALRWRYLLRPVRALSVRQLFPIVVIGYMANDVLPARLGEVVRAYVLRDRTGVPVATTLGTIVSERIFDGLVVVGFALVSIFSLSVEGQLLSYLVVTAVPFLVGFGLLLGLGAGGEKALRVLRALERRLPPRLGRAIGTYGERVFVGLSVAGARGDLLRVLVLSVLVWLCEALMFLFIGWSFALPVGFLGYLLLTATSTLSGLVPSAPGYVGTFDFGALLALGLLKVARASAAGYVLVLHIALILPVSLLGAFFLWRQHFVFTSRAETAGAGE